MTNFVIISLITFIVVFIALGIYYSIDQPLNKKKIDPIFFTDLYDPAVQWGVPSRDKDRGKCSLYQFEGSMNGDIAIPASPSLDNEILDRKQPMKIERCYDIDQIVAIKVQHECEGEEGFVSTCIDFEGRKVKIGDEETYYSKNISVKGSTISCESSPCSGILSLVGVNYDIPGIDNMVCILYDGEYKVGKCDISDTRQLMRLTRTTLNGKVPPTGDRNGKGGLFARIFDRTQDACLTASEDRTKIINDVCKGFVWLLLNELKGDTMFSPQQIVFVGDLTKDDFKDLFKQDSIDDIIDKLTSLDVKSIQIDEEGILVLNKFFTTDSEPNLQSSEAIEATGQYVDYLLFNQILNGEIRYPF